MHVLMRETHFFAVRIVEVRIDIPFGVQVVV